MKRFNFLLPLMVLLTLVVSACGGTTTTSGSQKVTINWWHINNTDPLKTAWQNLATQYMQTHKNVDIKISVIGTDQNYQQKLETAMQAGTPPDIFQSWGGGVMQEYAQAGQLQDISSALQQNGWGDTFSQSALSLYSYNGHYYGVPWDIGAVGFWYNPTLFAKASIQQPPATWNDFLTDIQKLKTAGIIPIALGEKDKWQGLFYWVYLAMREGGKTAFDNAYNRMGSFASPSYVKAGQLLQQLVAAKPFENGFMGEDYTAEQALMGNGKAAMELMGQWGPSNDAAAAADKKGPSLSFFPFPQVPGGAGNPTDVQGGGNGFAIGKNAPPQTLDFVRFLTQADNQRALAQKGALLPPVKAASDGVTNPNMQAVVKLVSNAPYFQLYYDQFLPSAVAQVAINSTQALFAGSATPLATAQAVEASAATALKKA